MTTPTIALVAIFEQSIQSIIAAIAFVNIPIYLRLMRSQVMAIRSLGRGGASEATTYTVTSFDPTDYNRDIAWSDGFFVRWPQKPTNN